MTLKNYLKFILFILLILIRSFQWAYLHLYAARHRWRLERKVKRANRLSRLENRRYIVTNLYGRPMCIAKQDLKVALIRRQFKKGVSIQDIEKHAYYITK
jgi:hypothetical protein